MANPNFPNNPGYNLYVGARYVPLFANPIEWDESKTYEPLTIVTHQGNSYTSKTFVPANTQITDTTYWALTGNYNAQVEQYRQEVLDLTPYANLIKEQLYGKNILIIGSSNETETPNYPGVNNWTVELKNILTGIANVTINAVAGRLLYDDMVALQGAITGQDIVIVAHSRNDAGNGIEPGSIDRPNAEKKDIASAAQLFRNIIGYNSACKFYYISMPRPNISVINSYKYPYALYQQMDMVVASWGGAYLIDGSNLFGNYPSGNTETIMPDGSHVTYPFTRYTALKVLFKILSSSSDYIIINETRALNSLVTAGENITINSTQINFSGTRCRINVEFSIESTPALNTKILTLDPSIVSLYNKGIFTAPLTIMSNASYNYYKGGAGFTGAIYFKEAAQENGTFTISFEFTNNNMWLLQ